MKTNLNADNILKTYFSKSLGLEKYAYIQKNVLITDVSKDLNFQRIFNGFYLVRKNFIWRNEYYNLFENVKKESLSFERIITSLYKKTGTIEASFSSKMLSSICPDKPVWDQHVLKSLDLYVKNSSPEERLSASVSVYNDMESWYKDYLKTDNARKNIQIFNSYFPSYSWISDVKKIDFLLWAKE